VVIPDERTCVEELELLGKPDFSLFHSTTNGAPYPLAEHVNTPLNGAAALVSVGWDTISGAGSITIKCIHVHY